jgi:hypothetical protein
VRGLKDKIGRALLVGVCVAGISATAVPATAGPTDLFEAQYEGRAERDPSTWLGFDVIRRDGVRKVARVGALLRYSCDNGDGGSAYGRASSRLRVGDEGRFSGKLEADQVKTRGPGNSVTYDIAGRLREGGGARGTIDAVLRFTSASPRGEPVRCYTGGLSWRAERGADTDPFSRRGSTELRGGT